MRPEHIRSGTKPLVRNVPSAITAPTPLLPSCYRVHGENTSRHRMLMRAHCVPWTTRARRLQSLRVQPASILPKGKWTALPAQVVTCVAGLTHRTVNLARRVRHQRKEPTHVQIALQVNSVTQVPQRANHAQTGHIALTGRVIALSALLGTRVCPATMLSLICAGLDTSAQLVLASAVNVLMVHFVLRDQRRRVQGHRLLIVKLGMFAITL